MHASLHHIIIVEFEWLGHSREIQLTVLFKMFDERLRHRRMWIVAVRGCRLILASGCYRKGIPHTALRKIPAGSPLRPGLSTGVTPLCL